MAQELERFNSSTFLVMRMGNTTVSNVGGCEAAISLRALRGDVATQSAQAEDGKNGAQPNGFPLGIGTDRCQVCYFH